MSAAAPGIRVKRGEQEAGDWFRGPEFLRWLDETRFLETWGRYEDEPLRLEPYQRSFLSFREPGKPRPRFRVANKSRQIGFSFGIALEALARAHLRDGHRAVFVSYNRKDAQEKIEIARAVYEELPLELQKPLAVDTKTELVFASRTRKRGKASRMMSFPSKATRGQKGDVYLDEIAHYKDDRVVFEGSMSTISRTGGQLTACSTPLGRRGIFYEIFTEELQAYPDFQRFECPWWMCSFFSSDPFRACLEAPELETAERVEAFGSEALKLQYRSLPLEIFQQEYEGLFVDESYSFFAFELIEGCAFEEAESPEEEAEAGGPRGDAGKIFIARDLSDVPRPAAGGFLVGGFDVGRTSDGSELALFEQLGDRFEARFLHTFRGVPFREQKALLRQAIDTLPIKRLSIDRMGIGRNLAEDLEEEFPDIVVPERFSTGSKEAWATGFKILMQEGRIALPMRRSVIRQIHSIRKQVSPTGQIQFVSPRRRGQHADQAWAIMLACQEERGPRGRIAVRSLG